MSNISNKFYSDLNLKGNKNSLRNPKSKVLNYLFRNFCFVNHKDNILAVSSHIIETISLETQIHSEKVEKIIKKFLIDLYYFKKFLNRVRLPWEYNLKQFNRKVRLILHKYFRLAPVFDYKRGIFNLVVLHRLLENKFYWPQITTQIALVIFVTDRNDDKISESNYILQKNLRAFCNCSAYAFHRARNKLGINKLGLIS